MRSSVPDGDLAKIIDLAVSEKLERLESKRFARTSRPRKILAQTDTTPRSRYIPAAVRRVVDERDGGRRTYGEERGRRCSERHDLEYHHRFPFARGGDHSPAVISLMCRAHNILLAELDYGKKDGVVPALWESCLRACVRSSGLMTAGRRRCASDLSAEIVVYRLGTRRFSSSNPLLGDGASPSDSTPALSMRNRWPATGKTSDPVRAFQHQLEDLWRRDARLNRVRVAELKPPVNQATSLRRQTSRIEFAGPSGRSVAW